MNEAIVIEPRLTDAVLAGVARALGGGAVPSIGGPGTEAAAREAISRDAATVLGAETGDAGGAGTSDGPFVGLAVTSAFVARVVAHHGADAAEAVFTDVVRAGLAAVGVSTDLAIGAVDPGAFVSEPNRTLVAVPVIVGALATTESVPGQTELLGWIVGLGAEADASTPPAGPAPHEFAPLRSSGAPLGGAGHGLDLIRDVEMTVTVELGRTRLAVRDLLALKGGSVIELDQAAGSPVDVLVNGTLIARGEVVVVDEEFGVRVAEIVGASEFGA